MKSLLSLVLAASLMGPSAALAASAPAPMEKGQAPASAPDDTLHGEEILLGVFEGTLPCAGCDGIRTELTLIMEGEHVFIGRFILRETYLSCVRSETVITGTWTILRGTNLDPDALVYEIYFGDPETRRAYVKVGDNTIRVLDRDGNEIISDEPLHLIRRTE
ncbi:MAG: hypothetical protein RJB62_164 [Pseudomonadota bacterium]|jgi:uncharacterized lipoprotein NlpE involved in copper resistance